MAKKLTTEQFIEKAKGIHGNKYDYSLVEYINNYTKIKFICIIHGLFEQRPNDFLNNKCGCKSCTKINRAQTNIEKYGVQNPQQNNKIREKTKQTIIQKYGVEHQSQSKIVRDKTILSYRIKYGYENPFKDISIRNKIKQTNIKKYGAEYPLQNIEIKEKTKITNLEKYGVKNPSQSKDVQDKMKKTNTEKYGIQFQIQKNIIDAIVFLDDEIWLSNIYENNSTSSIANILNVSETTVLNYLYKHKIDTKQTPGFSKKSISWLDAIMKQENIFIQHALNGGEYRIPNTKYRVDGYCKETNTIYEFHGDCFHGNPTLFDDNDKPNFYNKEVTAKELYTRTKQRENEIINLGYNLVTIWENDYKLYSANISLVNGINS